MLREIPEDAILHQQWNALVARADQPQVFYTWEWAFAVQRAYRDTLRPLLCLAFDERDCLCGVAALATDPAGRRISFLCATTGDYCDFIAEASQKSEFVSLVLTELRTQGDHDLTLTNLPGDSGTVVALQQAAARTGYHCFMRTAYECAQVSFDRLERGNDGQPVAPGRKRIRRFAKAMAADGAIECDHSRSWETLAPLLPAFVKAHVVRFLQLGRISNLANANRRLFLTDLARLLSEPQWLVLSRMSVGQQVYAWHYGFQFHDNWFWYQPTFDSSVEKYWPGFCLLTQVIQDATKNPALKRLDLGLGSEAYKAKFANASRRTLCVTLHRSLRKHWQEMVRYWAVSAITSRPRAERAVRSLIAKVRKFRGRAKQSGLSSALGSLVPRIANWVSARREVVFFEINSAVSAQSGGNSIRLISWALLADAAMRYCDDEETLQYLLRSAARLRERSAEGFALVDAHGEPLHFLWATDFQGFFLSELNAKVDSPSSDAVMLFDCWTPLEVRGRGYYGQAVEQVARVVRGQSKRAWIFSAAENTASVRGLEKSGLVRRYSLTRRRLLGWQRIKGVTPRSKGDSVAEVPARV